MEKHLLRRERTGTNGQRKSLVRKKDFDFQGQNNSPPIKVIRVKTLAIVFVALILPILAYLFNCTSILGAEFNIEDVGGPLSCYNAVVPEDRKQYRIDEQELAWLKRNEGVFCNHNTEFLRRKKVFKERRREENEDYLTTLLPPEDQKQLKIINAYQEQHPAVKQLPKHLAATCYDMHLKKEAQWKFLIGSNFLNPILESDKDNMAMISFVEFKNLCRNIPKSITLN